MAVFSLMERSSSAREVTSTNRTPFRMTIHRDREAPEQGLPLARRMTELHGGRLTVGSVKGVGTSVEVYLPANRILWPDGARTPQDAPIASER